MACPRSRPACIHVRGRRRACLPDSRAVLLDTAREVLLGRGLRGATIREIARRSGFSVTMIYYLFGGKDELACALARRAALDLQSDLAAFQSNGPDGVLTCARVRSFALLLQHHLGDASILGRLVRDPALQRFPLLGAELGRMGGKLRDRLRRFLEAEQTTGSLRPDLDLEGIACWVLSQATVHPPLAPSGRASVPIMEALLLAETSWCEALWWSIARNPVDGPRG